MSRFCRFFLSHHRARLLSLHSQDLQVFTLTARMRSCSIVPRGKITKRRIPEEGSARFFIRLSSHQSTIERWRPLPAQRGKNALSLPSAPPPLLSAPLFFKIHLPQRQPPSARGTCAGRGRPWRRRESRRRWRRMRLPRRR